MGGTGGLLVTTAPYRVERVTYGVSTFDAPLYDTIPHFEDIEIFPIGDVFARTGTLPPFHY